MTEHNFFAVAPKGLEALLVKELENILACSLKETKAGVRFSANLAMAYHVSLNTRLASRLLLQIGELEVDTIDRLYQAIGTIDWAQHFDDRQTFAVQFSGRLKGLTNNTFAVLRVKDAIVDQFYSRCGNRPNVDNERPDISIHVHCYKRKAEVSIDFSGLLHERGYRRQHGIAPIKENLAAALLLRSGFVDSTPSIVWDPMCGSATLLIEAAYMALGWPPGLLKKQWPFTAWKQHQENTWQDIFQQALQDREVNKPPSSTWRFIGTEIDPRVAEQARQNVSNANLSAYIHIETADFLTHEQCFDKPGLLISNLPYGERVADKSTLALLYQQLGQRLKTDFAEWKGSFLVADPLLLQKALPFRWQKKYHFQNGPLEVTLMNYTLSEDKIFERFDPFLITPNWLQGLSPGAQMLKNRLDKNLSKLKKWRKQNEIECFRVYDADLPEYAAAIDCYGDYLHIQEYQAPKTIDKQLAEHRLKEIIHVCAGLFGCDEERISVKNRRRQSANSQYEKQASRHNRFTVTENQLQFYVDLFNYIDTGLFLDHRIARALLREKASGKRFLNLFAYTGAASVYAAAGGAKSTLTLDMSKTYLQWARDNMELNGLMGAKHSFVQCDCIKWLLENKRQFDLIFLDPPTFSNSKRMVNAFDVQSQHGELIELCMKALTKEGELLFSNNFQRFKLEERLSEDYQVTELSNKTVSPDFIRNKRIHNSWLFRHLK